MQSQSGDRHANAAPMPTPCEECFLSEMLLVTQDVTCLVSAINPSEIFWCDISQDNAFRLILDPSIGVIASSAAAAAICGAANAISFLVGAGWPTRLFSVGGTTGAAVMPLSP